MDGTNNYSEALKLWIMERGADMHRLNRLPYIIVKVKSIEEGKIDPLSISLNDYFEVIYASLRTGSYPYEAGKDETNIGNVVCADTNRIMSKKDNDWSYRYPTNYAQRGLHEKNSCQRVTISAHASSILIEALDNFAYENPVYYKTSINFETWRNRHDPVIIFFMEPVTRDHLSVISNLTSPYVRNANLDHLVLGEKVCNGVYLNTQHTHEEVMELLGRANQLDSSLINIFRQGHNLVIDKITGEYEMSNGGFFVAKLMIDDFEAFKDQRPDSPIKDRIKLLEQVEKQERRAKLGI